METTEINNRRKGHVARLPKVLRDKINTMLDDGATYPAIVAELEKSTTPPLPYSINPDNIRRWFDGGYQDYLRNQAWNDRLLQRQEKFLDTTSNDPVKLADAGMQIAATGLCELLDELSHIDIKDQNASDRYARLTNAMTRLARIILTYSQHRDTVAKEKAAEPKQLDPDREFNDNDHRAVVKVIDKVLGIDRYRKLMMEQGAAAGRPWPTQHQTSATSNIAPATSADGAPVSNHPSDGAPVSNRPSEQGSDDRAASSSFEISNLKTEFPSANQEPASTSISEQGYDDRSPSSSVSETANSKPEIPSTTHSQPLPISDTERAERRPSNWYYLPDEAIQKWRKEHNLL